MTLCVPCPIVTFDAIYSKNTQTLLEQNLQERQISREPILMGFAQDYVKDDSIEGLAIKHAIVKTDQPRFKHLRTIRSIINEPEHKLMCELHLDHTLSLAIDDCADNFNDNLSARQFRAIYLPDAIILVANRPSDALEKIGEKIGSEAYTSDDLSSLVTIIVRRARSHHSALQERACLQRSVDFCNAALGLSNGAEELHLEIPEDFDQTK